MKPCAFSYFDPTTVSEATGLLGSKENARVLAGGQSLMPMMNFRYALPDALIDINGVAELDGIKVAGDRLEIGAMTRQRTLEYSDDIQTHCPLLAEAIPHIGHRQTRNRGTIGGSLAHADPAAELLTIAFAQDGVLQAESVRGKRTIPIADFSRGFMATALAPDELLTRVDLSIWPRGHGYAFVEFARRRGDFAIVSIAALIALDGTGAPGAVVRASLTVAGMASRPVRLTEAEELLTGAQVTPAIIADAAAVAARAEADSDIHASADYRRHLARVLTARALKIAAARAR